MTLSFEDPCIYSFARYQVRRKVQPFKNFYAPFYYPFDVICKKILL